MGRQLSLVAHAAAHHHPDQPLTFTCLAGPVLMPPHYGVRLPQPEELPGVLAADVEALRAHPAGAYALKLLATERR